MFQQKHKNALGMPNHPNDIASLAKNEGFKLNFAKRNIKARKGV